MFITYYWMYAVTNVNERYVYNFINMGEDLGGIIEIMLFTFSIFLLPISKFSFDIKSVKKLFLVRTSEEHLMRHVDKKCMSNKLTTSYKDYEFCLTKKDKCLLFCKNKLVCFRCVSCVECRRSRKRAEKLEFIFEKGRDKVNTSLNIATLIKNSRTLKILLENLILSDEIVHRIDHHDDNIIDVKDYKTNKYLDIFRKGLQQTIINQFINKLNKARDEKPKGLFGAFGSNLAAGLKKEKDD